MNVKHFVCLAKDFGLGAALLGLTTCLGCGKQSARAPVVPVHGRVLWQGKPLAHALVVLHPQNKAELGSQLGDRGHYHEDQQCRWIDRNENQNHATWTPARLRGVKWGPEKTRKGIPLLTQPVPTRPLSLLLLFLLSLSLSPLCFSSAWVKGSRFPSVLRDLNNHAGLGFLSSLGSIILDSGYPLWVLCLGERTMMQIQQRSLRQAAREGPRKAFSEQKAPAPPTEKIEKIRVTKLIRCSCGHEVEFMTKHKNNMQIILQRQQEFAAQPCGECRTKAAQLRNQQISAQARALRQQKIADQKAADQPKKRRPPQPPRQDERDSANPTGRLPLGSRFQVEYVAHKQWTGTLTIPDVGTFTAQADAVFKLLKILDRQYRERTATGVT
jgi:hypothetical protein